MVCIHFKNIAHIVMYMHNCETSLVCLVQYFDNIEQMYTVVNFSFHYSLLCADDLHDYFQKFGKISDATVKTDPSTGRSKGFGFVVFVDPSAVDEVTWNLASSG